MATGGIGTAVYFAMRPSLTTVSMREESQVSAQPAKAELSPSADRDFFAILALSYENHAVLAFKAFMLDDAEKFAAFYAVEGDSIEAGTAAIKARQLAADICEKEVEDLERQKLEKKREFLDRHQLDSKDYAATFKRSHPSCDLLFEEIVVMTRKHVRSKVHDWSRELTLDHGRRTQNAPRSLTREDVALMNREWFEFRTKLLEREVPKTIRELREKVRALPSVREMAAKIG